MRKAILFFMLLLAPASACAETGQEENVEIHALTEIAEAVVEETHTGGSLLPERKLTRSAAALTKESDGTVGLFERPDEASAVLMEYYSGAPLEIIRAAGSGFYQVQAGERDASLMGYMRAQDLEAGDASRLVQPCFMELRFNRETHVYAYCDEGAKVIGTCEPGKTYYAMSKNEDKWVQLFLPPKPHVREEAERMTYGFVHLETGMAHGYWQELEHWETEPAGTEMTREQAMELALNHLEGGQSGGMPDVYEDRAELERMESRAYLRVIRGSDRPAAWMIFFWQSEGEDAAYVMLHISGTELLGISASYISAEDWSAYSVEPVL